jgi:hypothetical protein
MYFSSDMSDQIKKDSVGMGQMRNAYNILVGNPESNRPLGRYRCKRVNNNNPSKLSGNYMYQLL